MFTALSRFVLFPLLIFLAMRLPMPEQSVVKVIPLPISVPKARVLRAPESDRSLRAGAMDR